jgi:hypothetical protein
MKRVLCDATIDRCETGSLVVTVTVTGRGEHEGIVRVYDAWNPNDDDAAREGIRRFVKELGGDL